MFEVSLRPKIARSRLMSEHRMPPGYWSDARVMIPMPLARVFTAIHAIQLKGIEDE